MIVYQATNTVSGMAYVGATKQSLAVRKREHKSAAKGAASRSKFHAAIRAFGFDAFEWSVLWEGDSLSEMCLQERRLIEERDSIANGYNTVAGGIGVVGYVFTAEDKAKISRAVKDFQFSIGNGFKKRRQGALFHSRLGVPHTEEAKRKISEAGKALPYERRAHKLHPRQYPEIKALREAGQSFRLIGLAYGVRPETVFYFCKRLGAQP